MSEYGTAQKLFELAFAEMSRANSGVTALDVISAWVGISCSLRLLGKYDEAQDTAQDVRDFGQNASGLGMEHLSTLRAVNAYLITSRRLPEKRLDAVEEGTAILDLATRRHGPSHPDTLAIAAGMSNLMRAAGVSFHEKALELADATAERISAVYGASHPYTHGCKANLALLSRITGNAARACVLDQQALDGLRAVLGENHHYTLTAASNLASDFAALGQLAEARAVGAATLPKLAELLGATHSHTLGCATNLALDMITDSDAEAGTDLQDASLRLLADTYGESSPDYQAAARMERFASDFDPPPI